jgi:hypothetical protein
MPAVPLDEAGKFVAGAYVVFVGLILIYVAIMAAKVGRIERELRSLTGLAEERFGVEPEGDDGPSGRKADPQFPDKPPEPEP